MAEKEGENLTFAGYSMYQTFMLLLYTPNNTPKISFPFYR